MSDSLTSSEIAGKTDQVIKNDPINVLLANILDAYPDKASIYVKNKEGRYLGCSRAFLELLGLPSEKIIGKTARDIFPPEIAEEDEIGDRALHWVIGLEKMEVMVEINGKERCLLFKKNVFCSGSGTLPGGIIGVVNDITAMKNRTVKKEMMDAMAAVSPGIYHDICNLLTPIDTFLTMIESDIVKMKKSCYSTEDKLNNIKTILPHMRKHGNEALSGKEMTDSHAVEHLVTPLEIFVSSIQANIIRHERFLGLGIRSLNQIKSMLELLQRLAKGKVAVPESVFDVNDVLLEATAFIFPSSKIRKELILCENPWPVKLDYLSTFRILLNLVTNSVQAMPHGGILKCETENRLVDGGKFVKITVADTGGGIPVEVLNEMDQPHATTKSDGHGYGLCVVSSMIKKCGGLKEIKSQQGHGTEFDILLPVSLNVADDIKNILKKYDSQVT
jgi:PAS domain S-box-containing protein